MSKIYSERTDWVLQAQKAAGYPFEVLDYNAEGGQPSGGQPGTARHDWGKSLIGGGAQWERSVREGNPEEVTFDISIDMEARNWLVNAIIGRKNSYFLNRQEAGNPSVRMVYMPGVVDKTNRSDFQRAIQAVGALPTGFDLNEAPVNATDNPNMRLRETYPMSAAAMVWLDRPIVRSATTAIAKAYQAIIFEPGSDERYWAVVEGDTGVEPQWVLITIDNENDGAITVSAGADITVFAENDVTGLAISQGRLLAAHPAYGVAYARLSDLRAGTNSWTLATGISTNFPTAIHVAADGTVWAAGAGGYIWKSTNGGQSFTEIDSAATISNDYVSIAFADADFGWFGSASGDLVLYDSGIFATVDISSYTTDSLTALAVPPARDNELYIGTDGGEIWATRTARDAIPVFSQRFLPANDSTGVVNQIKFGPGLNGVTMYVLHTLAGGSSVLYRDESSGAMGPDAWQLNLSGANSGIAAFDIVDPNTGFCVGAVNPTNGFLARIAVS